GNTGGDTGNTGGDTGNTGGDTGNTVEDFNKNREYTGALLNRYNGSTSTSVNYLGAINAASAYTALKDVALNTVHVGVLDSGVWGNHPEFLMADGNSKVTGYNYDYGPCRNGDNSHCWALLTSGNTGVSYMVLYGEKGVIADSYSDLSEDEFEDAMMWMASYPADYDWDSAKYHNYYYPNSYQVIGDTGLMHGTNVAGIIAAQKNDIGSMGVAYENARITAIRWDFYSSIYDPMIKFLNDGVFAVNLSIGVDADDDLNAANINDVSTGWGTSYLQAVRKIIQANTTKNGHVDGMIVVKAAGNESYSQPDVQSGVKLLKKSFGSIFSPRYYNELQMVVVTAVDVDVDAAGHINGYKLSNFANQCGVTKNYCIAAPGGDTNAANTYTTKALYAPGETDTTNRYYGMAGTSQATPIVTGSLAYLKGAYPYLTSSELIELILTTANKNSTDTFTAEKYGAGLLDLGAAVSTYVSDSRNTFKITTFNGTDTQSRKISLDDTRLSVPSAMQNALMKALPKTITAFDKYNRPFEFATSSFVQKTHGGYRSFKNDVRKAASRRKINHEEHDNIRFAFSEPNAKTDPYAWKYMDVSYRQGAHEFGFYFSENTAYDAEKYFAKETLNPFMSFNNAYGVRNQYHLTSSSELKIDAVYGRNGLYDGDYDYRDAKFTRPAYALNSTLTVYQNKQYQLGISSGVLAEEDALLGMNGSGAMAVERGQTFHGGVTASWFVTPALTISGSYYQGFTRGLSMNSGLIETSDLVSESFAADMNYQWDKTLNFGMQISSPLRIRKGELSVDFPQGRDSYSEEVYRARYQARLKPDSREYKFNFYADKEISPRLSWRAETGVRIHPEHQRGKNDYRMIVGLNWTFN
ncbi:MAG: S8 family serine peptidase, partial [Alphaproteobacteria bacterium]|nr:S8 family serine peptidase [Alphaproteobacteria bacterium]